MPAFALPIRLLLVALAVVASATRLCAIEPPVKMVRVPDAGIQPQAAVDDKGVIHLIYFKGDPAKGDIFYVHSADGGATFSAPVRVNSQPGSAIAIGTIRVRPSGPRPGGASTSRGTDRAPPNRAGRRT